MMIYSKFGTPLALISKTESAGGRVMVQATEVGSADIHEYSISDLKADSGMSEIEAAIAALQPKVFGSGHTRRRHRPG
jgi:hypothetical protein